MKPKRSGANQSKVQSLQTSPPKTGVRTKVQILWTVRQSSLLSKLSFNIVREVCDYIELTKYLTWVHDNSLRVYDLTNGDSVQTTIAHFFTSGSVYCGVDEETVICLGGKIGQREVYFLSLFEYKLTQVESMHTPRFSPGVVSYQGRVYVFGGSDTNGLLTSCEKFAQSSGVWTDLSSMRYPRRCFTPGLYQGVVYLPECTLHRVMERFSLVTEEFTTLSIELPQLTAFVSFIICGEFFILSSNAVWKWRVNSKLSSSRNSQTSGRGETFSPCPPVVVGRKAYWVRSDTRELRFFDADHLAIIDV